MESCAPARDAELSACSEISRVRLMPCCGLSSPSFKWLQRSDREQELPNAATWRGASQVPVSRGQEAAQTHAWCSGGGFEVASDMQRLTETRSTGSREILSIFR